MDTSNQAVVVLARALDQAGDALAAIHSDDLDKPTPCSDWTVRDLAAHLASAPSRFLAVRRGEDVDWSTHPAIADGTWATVFRAAGDDLIHHWHGQPADQSADPAGQADWQSAELAVHTWDLARAIGWSGPLDEEVAERGLAFLQQGLTDDNRGPAFAAPVQVGGDAAAYDRLVAFAGREPRT